MGNPLESRPGGAPQEKPRIETIGAAAAEVTRLYGVFKTQAVPVDTAYITSQLAGEQGETWDILHTGFHEKRVPFLPPIITHNGRLKLGARMTFMHSIISDYSIQEGMTFKPGPVEAQKEVLGTEWKWTRDGEIKVPGALRVIEGRASRDSGSDFVVIGDNVLKTGYPNSPRTGREISGEYSLLTEVEPSLLRVIKAIQKYDK